MYAVISDRGRQAQVKVGDVVRCDHHPNVTPGASISFDQVLLVSNEGEVKVGTPILEGATVTGEIIGDAKAKKLVVFRFKRRKNVRVKNGHRQTYTDVRITAINA